MFGRFKTPERSRGRKRTSAAATPKTSNGPAHESPGPPKSLAAIERRLDEIASQRSKTADLIVRFERASEAARTATAEMADAREERDQYRRVLAAAIGAERRSEERLVRAEERRQSAELAAREEARAAGAATAERDVLSHQVTSLEKLVRSQSASHERAIADLADRSSIEREALRADLVKLGLAAERAAEAAAHAARGAEIAGLRRRLLVGLGVTAAVLGIAMTPPAVLAAFDPERAIFVHMASGLSPWVLVGCAVGAFALALTLLGIAKRESDRSARIA